MRTWRVGTISMGATLLFLGIFLLISQFTEIGLTHIMISWWPIILVVLGLEILIYLFMTRTEKPLLKYDFLSIFFVGIIGMIGIGFMILSSVGLLDLIDESLSREERTLDLPELTENLGTTIKRVVVDANHYPIKVESTSGLEVSVFGTFTASVAKGAKLVSGVEDYLSVHKKGDTLFLDLKNLPSQSTVFNYYHSQIDATVLIPDGVKLEVHGQGNDIALKPRDMKNNWVIENASDVALYVEEDSDLHISASHVDGIVGEEGTWVTEGQKKSTVTDDNKDEEINRNHKAEYKMGNGTHRINIVKAHQVSLNIINN